MSIFNRINPQEMEYLLRVGDIRRLEYILDKEVRSEVEKYMGIDKDRAMATTSGTPGRLKNREDYMNYYGGQLRDQFQGGQLGIPSSTTVASPQVIVTEKIVFKDSPSAEALEKAKTIITQLDELLNNIRREPLILQRIDRLTKDKKHCYVKKAGLDLRILAPKDLAPGDEVLLHPKTFQIVEILGRPPLEVSRFAPDVLPNVSWQDIGGLEQAKADLIEAVELPHANKDLIAFYKKKPIKGILLSGPPGCGKTMLGKAAACSLARIHGKATSKTGFLYVKGPVRHR